MLKVALTLDELDHHRMFRTELELGDWVWCLHCERAFQYGEYREVAVDSVVAPYRDEPFQLCPYDSCDGSPLDWWEWNRVREGHSDYPLVPTRGKQYPLY